MSRAEDRKKEQKQTNKHTHTKKNKNKTLKTFAYVNILPGLDRELALII